MSPVYSLDVIYDEAKSLLAAKTWFRASYTHNQRMHVALIIWLIGMLLIGMLSLFDRGVIWIVLATAYIGLFLLIAWSLFFHYRTSVSNMKKHLAKMVDPTYHFEFDESAFRSRSEFGSTELQWRTFYQLIQSDELWLLCISQNIFYIFPTEQLSPEAQQLMLTQLKQCNVPVKEIS